MPVTARLNHYRLAPRKLRLVADLIRGKQALEAKSILRFLPKRGAVIFEKLLDSAIANAKNNFNLEENSLFISKVLVDEGQKLKRWRPRSRGRAFPIQKKTSHIMIVLDAASGSKTVRSKKKTEIAARRAAEIAEKAKEARSTKQKHAFLPKKEMKKKPLGAPAAFKRIFRRKAI